MSQAVTDLPDPLQPLPVMPASSPDDLLSKMADEAIDKLMAEADKGTSAAAAPLPPMSSVAPDADPPVEPVAVASTSAAPVDAVAGAASASPAAETAGHSETTVATTPSTPNASAAAASASSAPEAQADLKALLDETPAKPSVLLLPLQVLNAPFAGLGDTARRFLGLLGVVTLVPAVCAIVYYVVYLKHH